MIYNLHERCSSQRHRSPVVCLQNRNSSIIYLSVWQKCSLELARIHQSFTYNILGNAIAIIYIYTYKYEYRERDGLIESRIVIQNQSSNTITTQMNQVICVSL